MPLNTRIYLLIFSSAVLSFIIRAVWLYLCPYAFLDNDMATVGLMAGHILKGHLPVFFYGQNYLVPAESYLTALFFIIFGKSFIVLQFVPALLMTAVSLAVYFLGKELKNRETGLFAMLYFLFPPPQLFYRSFKSQGYIPEYMLLGTAALIISLRILTGDKKKLYYIMLGISTGTAFWLTEMTAYFIIVSGIFLLLNAKRSRILRYGFLWLLSFFAAGAPYWIFSLNRRIGSISFGGGKCTGIISLLKKIAGYDIKILIGANTAGPTGAVLYILWAVIIASFAFYSLRKRDKNLSILWLIPAAVFFFYIQPSISRLAIRGTTRYVSCLYIFMAAAAGYTAYRFNQHIRHSGTIFMSFLLCINMLGLYMDIPSSVTHSRKNRNRCRQYLSFLNSIHINRLIVPEKRFRDIEFYSREKIICEEYGGTNYKGYNTETESAQEIGIWMPGIENSLSVLCADFQSKNGFYYRFREFPYRYKEILPDKWKITAGTNNKSALYAADRNYSSYWSTIIPKGKNMGFQADLGGIYNIARLEFFYNDHYRNLPVDTALYTSVNGTDWEKVLSTDRLMPLFWSGPRLYMHMHYGRCELAFRPKRARYIRITQDGREGIHPWEINELFIYEYAGEGIKGQRENNISSAYRFLKERGIDFVYADFWESSRIIKYSIGKMKALTPFNVLNFNAEEESRIIKWEKDRAFIIPEDNREGWERIISEFNIPLYRKRFGRYYCYYFGSIGRTESEYLKEIESVYWIGKTGVKTDLYKYGLFLYKEGQYALSLKYFPRMRAYVKLKKRGYDTSLWDALFVPKTNTDIVFKNGIALKGITMPKTAAKSGSSVTIDYFWKLKKRPEKDIFAFIYFMKGKKIVFQGDSKLWIDFPKELSPAEDDIFRQRCVINIPQDTPAGYYRIETGLWDRSTGKRIHIKNTNRSKIKLGRIEVKSGTAPSR